MLVQRLERQVRLGCRRRLLLVPTPHATPTPCRQVPADILHNAALNAAIALLPANYSFEVHKTLWRIRQAGARRVALQFPEGLLLYACVIADILEGWAGWRCVCGSVWVRVAMLYGVACVLGVGMCVLAVTGSGVGEGPKGCPRRPGARASALGKPERGGRSWGVLVAGPGAGPSPRCLLAPRWPALPTAPAARAASAAPALHLGTQVWRGGPDVHPGRRHLWRLLRG